MTASHRYLIDSLNSKGQVRADDLPELLELVERYPYYHLARLTLLRVLYQQRDASFNGELRRAALFLPSRETIFRFVEADRMVPQEEKPVSALGGATLSRKPSERLGSKAEGRVPDRTGSLIDSFLSSIPSTEMPASRPAAPVRRGRADATTDYISYMLEEEMALQAVQSSIQPADNTPLPATRDTMSAEEGTDGLIDKFIQKQGDRRITLKDKSDSDLQKPTLNADNVSQKGAFTETLARIYIKQGKFEHAIEIIRRLSLKYPKKNRYFADQIRFLEKIIANNKAKEGL